MPEHPHRGSTFEDFLKEEGILCQRLRKFAPE